MANPTLPKTYRLEGALRLFVIASCILIAAAFIAAIWFARDNQTTELGRMFVSGVLLALAIGFVLLGYMGVKSTTVLHDDRVEQFGAFTERRLFGHEIAGVRQSAKGYLRLMPKNANVKAMTVPEKLRDDGAGLPWIDGLPDLDAADRAATDAAILNHPRLGATPSERQAFIARVRGPMTWLARAGWVVGLWGFLYPYPYLAANAALVLVPLLGLAAMIWAHPLVTLNDYGTSDRGNGVAIPIWGAMFMPACALAMRALVDTQWIDTLSLLGLALALGVVAAVAVWRTELRTPGWTSFGVLFLGTVYFAGALGQANVLLDGGPATRHEVVVHDKYVTSGKDAQHKFEVGPWGEESGKNQVVVTRRVYDAVQPGDTVCIFQMPGALGWRWYEVDRCR